MKFMKKVAGRLKRSISDRSGKVLSDRSETVVSRGSSSEDPDQKFIIVKYAVGTTVSRAYQGVRVDVGVELPFPVSISTLEDEEELQAVAAKRIEVAKCVADVALEKTMEEASTLLARLIDDNG